MIRRATTADTEVLGSLLYQVHKIHSDGRPDIFQKGTRKYSDEELAVLIADDTSPIFVYEDGEVCGYAFCIFQNEPGNDNLLPRKTLYIDDLCVDENCRSRNIGRALYEYVLDVARAAGCDAVTLNVWSFNTSAAAFYEKMGMSPLKTVMEQKL